MKAYVLGAGFVCISLAIFIQGILPIAIPESRETRATRAVRTDLGDVKWVWYESSPYTPLEQLGRNVYQREGCWYCHSQYVRPVTGEDMRWGPVSQVGEYAHDWPHLLSTRRIGPDLTRVGLKYGDAWHFAHHWVPTEVVPDSIMPSFRWLYRTARVAVVEKDGEVALADSPALRTLFSGKVGPEAHASPQPGGARLLPGDGRDAGPRREEPAGAVREGRHVEGQNAHRHRADRGAAWARRLHPEARDQSGGVAGRLRAPDPVGQRDGHPAHRGAGGPRPGRVRAALRRLSRAERRRERPGGDVPRAASPGLPAGRLQVPHDAVGLTADGRRPLPDPDAGAPVHGHAHLARAAREGPDLRHQLHQDVLETVDGREAGAADPDRRAAEGDPRALGAGQGALRQGEVLPVPRGRRERATVPRPTSSPTTGGSRSCPSTSREASSRAVRTSGTSSGR